MLRFISLFALTMALTAAHGASSEAGSRKGVRSAPPPVKDCTRFNGRWGYYGNPWCTPAEQLAFDRAEARRLGR
ncbi:hypothetical protein GIW81_13010 [Hyphomicrobium sp. xq]|uniref:YARHG domain-containing protein n=1 Tax=Hyphomicrobium album TaxID=2665159 RepID=A0A6I3KNC6_9HYPH|nr:hypothetical protein [Hyphomicrobium album]MTD95252.1 hypothetical protein [Hyphomicrobium album]